MRFYKGDIVEVLRGDYMGQRYRLTNVRLSWDNVTVVLDTGIDARVMGEIRFRPIDVMLYHRPIVNHIKHLFNTKN